MIGLIGRVAAVAAFAAAVSPQPARACSEVTCFGISVAAGSSFPANRVAFAVPEGIVALTTMDGQLVPTKRTTVHGEAFLIPDQPLAPNATYRLHYDTGCYNGSGVLTGGDASQILAIDFATTPAAEVPASIGALRVVSRERILESDGRQRAESVIVALDPTAELAVWRSLLTWTVTVDGRPWSSLNDRRTDESAEFEVRGICDDYLPGSDHWDRDSCGLTYRAPVGKRHVTVTAHLRGTESDPPPVSIDVTLACGAGSTTTSGPQPGTDGCSYGGGGAPSGGLAWLLAVAAMASRRRRRC